MASPEESEHEHHQSEPGGGPTRPDPRILEDVLQRTILLSDDSADTVEDLQCLRPVAEKHRGADINEALPHLVRAMLARVFGQTIDAEWAGMTETITSSLLDDPAARERVEKLWKRLCSTEIQG